MFSSGKILDVRQIAGVKDMTNIMSDPELPNEKSWDTCTMHFSQEEICPMEQI